MYCNEIGFIVAVVRYLVVEATCHSKRVLVSRSGYWYFNRKCGLGIDFGLARSVLVLVVQLNNYKYTFP